MEIAQLKKSEEPTSVSVDRGQLSTTKTSFSPKEDRKLEPKNETADDRKVKKVDKEVRRKKKFKKSAAPVKMHSGVRQSKKSIRITKSLSRKSTTSLLQPNVNPKKQKAFKEHITDLLSTLRSWTRDADSVGRFGSMSSGQWKATESKSTEKIITTEDETKTEVATERLREKKRKTKKKDKFKKKKFIKEMMATEEQLLNFEKERQHMEIDRKKMLSYWNNIADRIVKAENMRNSLLKKFESLKLDDKFGLWEVARRDRNTFFTNYNKELIEIKMSCINTLDGALKDLDRKHLEYQKDIFDHNKQRLQIAQELISFTFASWKVVTGEFSQMIVDTEPQLKMKSQLLIDKEKKELELFTSSIPSDFQIIEGERAMRLEETFAENYRALLMDLKHLSSKLQPSSELIDSLSTKLAKAIISHSHKKNEWEQTSAVFNDLSERNKDAKLKSKQLKQTAAFASEIKKKIRRILRKHKRLEKIQQFCLVCKSWGKEILRKFTERLTSETKALEELTIKNKKDYFKSLICSIFSAKASTFHLLRLTDISRQLGLSKRSKHKKQFKLMTAAQEFTFPEEGGKILMRKFVPKSQEVLYQMYIVARELYHSTVNAVLRKFKQNCLHTDDFTFKLNRGKQISMGRIEEYEKLALSLMMRKGPERKVMI